MTSQRLTTLDADLIIAAIASLKRRDRDLVVFGANGHRYILNPPIDASIVLDFERLHCVQLPADYRQFITRIGNGGAGPYYGVFKFGEHDEAWGHRDWDGGHLTGNFARPFPHTTAWNLPREFWMARPQADLDTPEDEEDRLWEEWDKILDRDYWNPSLVDGAIPICHLGCAIRHWLVINGPQRSFIWNDDRANEGGLSPVIDKLGNQQTFTEWYLGWLNDALETVKI